MSAITAAAVKELREITGVAMMDCKKALVECNGDLEEAKEFLRKKGQAKALKKSSRETREGAVKSELTKITDPARSSNSPVKPILWQEMNRLKPCSRPSAGRCFHRVQMR